MPAWRRGRGPIPGTNHGVHARDGGRKVLRDNGVGIGGGAATLTGSGRFQSISSENCNRSTASHCRTGGTTSQRESCSVVMSGAFPSELNVQFSPTNLGSAQRSAGSHQASWPACVGRWLCPHYRAGRLIGLSSRVNSLGELGRPTAGAVPQRVPRTPDEPIRSHCPREPANCPESDAMRTRRASYSAGGSWRGPSAPRNSRGPSRSINSGGRPRAACPKDRSSAGARPNGERSAWASGRPERPSSP